MGRRRVSAPSPLVLRPSNVPLRRGQPKFVLPSPPSTQALHVVGSVGPSDPRTTTAARTERCSRRRGDSIALKEMPRLELGELLKQAVERGEGFNAGAVMPVQVHGQRVHERAEGGKRGEENGEENGQRTASSTGSSAGDRMGLGVKPWSGKDALLPQIAVW